MDPKATPSSDPNRFYRTTFTDTAGSRVDQADLASLPAIGPQSYWIGNNGRKYRVVEHIVDGSRSDSRGVGVSATVILEPVAN